MPATRYSGVNPREELKRELLFRRGHVCEGELVLPHRHGGGLHMHEVFYKRNDAKTTEQRRHLIDARNCTLVCARFHARHGNSNWFTGWWTHEAVRRFGAPEVRAYLDGAPLLDKRRLDALLSIDWQSQLPDSP